MDAVNVDIVSDVMCPWCYIGKRRMEKALAMLDSVTVNLRWRPYQLDPTLPREGRDRKAYLEAKFGGPERAKQIYQSIEETGRSEGLDFAFSAIKVSPNTIDAHRVIRWSINEGADVQDKLVERLFILYFMEGAHLGDHDVLADAATHAGMDGEIVRSLLATDKDRAEVEQEIATARQMGVTGVPCFVIDNKYAVMGAQDPQYIADAIRQAAEMKSVSAPGAT
ncbi:MAG: DsbA family oxidoreductase [Ahrensia sp.]|nr:DsbA family oxidoreductase [Ahrensia sp.]